MDKIICDLCGTSYPDTASQCPICGTARTDASKQQSADMTADTYAYVRGGRFSKSNVRKRNNGQPENRRQPAQPSPASQKQAPKKAQPQPQPEEEEGGSNRGLVIVVVILLLAIIAMCVFVAVKFIDLSKAGGQNHTNSSQSTVSDPVKIPCESISVDQKELSFTAANKTILLQPVVQPANTTDQVIFASSDDRIVKVDADGLVTPVANGEATITITCGSFSAQCKVTCEGLEPPVTEPDPTEPDPTDPEPTDPEPTEPDPTEPEPSTRLCLNRVDFTLNGYGATWDLTRNSPDQFGNNYEGPADPSQITWTSKDPAIATVENGVVTAVGNGKTYVVAEYNGHIRECIVRCVNVTAPTGGETEAAAYALNHTDVTMDPGETLYQRLRLVDNATGQNVLDVTYSVADSSVCTVDADGKVVAQTDAAGRSTQITVEYNGQTYTCIVRVRAK